MRFRITGKVRNKTKTIEGIFNSFTEAFNYGLVNFYKVLDCKEYIGLKGKEWI